MKTEVLNQQKWTLAVAHIATTRKYDDKASKALAHTYGSARQALELRDFVEAKNAGVTVFSYNDPAKVFEAVSTAEDRMKMKLHHMVKNIFSLQSELGKENEILKRLLNCKVDAGEVVATEKIVTAGRVFDAPTEIRIANEAVAVLLQLAEELFNEPLLKEVY